MKLDSSRFSYLAGAVAVRVLLAVVFPSLPDLLTGRVEVSTPVTSFKRLKEGVFLHTHNVSPYDGGVFYQAPLLLSIFELSPSLTSDLFSVILYSIVDVVAALALMNIADSQISSKNSRFTSNQHGIRWSSAAVGAAYLFNPFAIAACLGRTTIQFTNCAILTAISQAVSRRPLNAMLAIAFASYLSIYPALLVLPLLLLCQDVMDGSSPGTKAGKKANPSQIYFSSTITFLLALGSLLGMSYAITGFSWEFLTSVYGTQILMTDLTPNVGLWWYFFIEMFDPFRDFFIGVFWLHLASYVVGLSIRVRNQPLFVLMTMTGVLAIFKPYPSIADASLYLSFIPLYRHVFPLMRYSFFAFAVLLYATALGPAFYHLWIYAGSGNANFFYAITLVWSLGLSIIVADTLWAVLRDEWELERPEMKGKAAKQI